MTVKNKIPMFNDLIQLRLIVGFLGEKNQFGWWDTNFLSKTGLQFLDINFPRTALAAGLNSVTEAARRLHDDRIGKGGVYHLFRFPSGVEEDLHRLFFTADQKELLALLESQDTAMGALSSMVSDSVGAPEGPVQIGNLKNMLQEFSVKEIAVHYYEAFKNQKMCLPYFKAN